VTFVQPEPAETVVPHDDVDVHLRERPFHTHPFLTAQGKAGHAHPGADQPHSHTAVAPYRAERYTTMAEYLAFVRRVIGGLGERVGEADLEALAEMTKLRDLMDGAMLAAVAGLRHDEAAPASWGEIGEALGVTRQAAQKRYGAVGGARKPGGQRSDWR
jgi:hypothetical protein